MWNWFDGIVISFCLFFFGSFIFAVSILFFDAFTGTSCSSKAKVMGLQHEYGIYLGCMVKLNDVYIPMKEVLAVERDGKIIYVPNSPTRIDLNMKGNK